MTINIYKPWGNYTVFCPPTILIACLTVLIHKKLIYCFFQIITIQQSLHDMQIHFIHCTQ